MMMIYLDELYVEALYDETLRRTGLEWDPFDWLWDEMTELLRFQEDFE